MCMPFPRAVVLSVSVSAILVEVAVALHAPIFQQSVALDIYQS
jgi:hypothetical protein